MFWIFVRNVCFIWFVIVCFFGEGGVLLYVVRSEIVNKDGINSFVFMCFFCFLF